MVSSRAASGVSALVFAAGLGMAVAANPAIASADTAESSTSSASSSSASDSSESKSETESKSKSKGAEHADTSADDDSGQESTSATDEEADAPDADDPADSSSSEDEDQTPVTVDDRDPSGSDDQVRATAPLKSKSAGVQPATKTVTTEVTPLSVPAPAETATAQAVPLADPEIPAPVVSPLELFWAAARRTIVGAFYNQAPTTAQVQLGQSEAAQVVGMLGATDPDGDPLRYRITKQAANGTVVVNPDGTYVYTPNAAFAATGGTDTFTMQVRDVGFRLFSPVRRVSVPVTVSVSPDVAPVQIAVGRNPVSVVLSPDGKRAYIGGTKLEIIDTATNSVIGTISTTGFQSALAISANGKRLYAANSVDGKVSVIDTDHNVPIATITVGSGPRGLALSANGTTLYAANSNDGTVSVIDTATNTVITTVMVGDDPRELAVNHDNTRVYVANAGSNSVSVIDATTHSITATIDVSGGIAGAEPDAIVVSADGKQVYVANFGGSNVVVIDAVTNKVAGTIAVDFGASPDGLALSADGKTLYVANSNRGSLSAIDLAKRAVTATITTGGFPVAVAVAGNHAYVASSTDATVTVLTLASRSFDAPKPPAVGATRGFTVVNLTGSDLVFAGFSYKQGDSTGGPAIGSVLRPGESHEFNVTYRVFYETKAVVQYRYPGSAVDNYEATMIVEEVTAGKKGGCRARTGGECSTSDTFYDDIDAIYFKDAKNTVVNVSANDKRAIDLLTGLCIDGSRASCTFKPKSQLQSVIGPRHQVGDSETNTTTSIPRELTFSRSEQVSEQTSLKVTGKASVKIGALVTAEFSSEYGKVYTKTETFSKTEKITLPPRTGVAWTYTTPFLRASGDFTLVMGNTTFHVTGANFDTPDPQGNGNWNLQDYPLPPTEAAEEV